VAVPYPFGMGSPRCYSPGFNLTCDYHTSGHEHPRLLLDDYGHLRVINISLENTTVHVVRTGALIDSTSILDDFSFDHFFTGLVLSARREKLPYALSTRNELILLGCNVQVMLLGAGSYLSERRTYLSGCSSLCSLDGNSSYAAASSNGDMNCYGVDCCQARISMSKDGFPDAISLVRIDKSSAKKLPIYAFVAEEGWFDRRKVSNQPRQEVPIVLDWEILQQPASGRLPITNICLPEVANVICKSKNSRCVPGIRGYTCQCVDGYKGNPYTAVGGCTRRRKLKGT
jgi:hypothetical protein